MPTPWPNPAPLKVHGPGAADETAWSAAADVVAARAPGRRHRDEGHGEHGAEEGGEAATAKGVRHAVIVHRSVRRGQPC
uniref:Uncharacterized protein n=1 Tax=Janibacter limosus TaxID=53458 RepID=A0AC61U205_9MICO|nr:hypothetical protein [Janibacter limosus]